MGVVYLEGSFTLGAGTHDFHVPNWARWFPIPFRAEAVPIGHQSLYGNSRKLREATQVFKGIGECAGPGLFKEVPQAQLDSCCLVQHPAPATMGTQRLRDRVRFIIFSRQLLGLCS